MKKSGGIIMNGFDYQNVKDPKVFAISRMEAHSDHVCYADWAEEATGESSYRLSLDGIWKFHYAKNYEQTIKGFECEEYVAKNWDDIRVPAHIQLEGYDIPQYVNIQYPWDGSCLLYTSQSPRD